MRLINKLNRMLSIRSKNNLSNKNVRWQRLIIMYTNLNKLWNVLSLCFLTTMKCLALKVQNTIQLLKEFGNCQISFNSLVKLNR